MLKNFTLEDTKNPNIKRVVDRDGNWRHYYVVSLKQYFDSVTFILDQGFAAPELMNWMRNTDPGEIEERGLAARRKGDKVHRAIDLLLSGAREIRHDEGVYDRESNEHEKITPPEWNALLSFQCFWEEHEPVLYSSEASLYSAGMSYAGTADGMIVLTKECGNPRCSCKNFIGQLGLWDWKTSSRIAASYGAQVAAYASAENLDDYLPKGAKITYTAIARFGTKHACGYELEFYDEEETARHLSRFLSAKSIARAQLGYKPFDEAKIVEIPESVSIKIVAPKAIKKSPAKPKRAKAKAKK